MTIRVEIDELGQVTGSQIVTSSNLEVLDRFLQSWIKDWQYLPRLKDDQPADGFGIVVIDYDLRTKSFKAPSPITEAIQIPEALAKVMVQSRSNNRD